MTEDKLRQMARRKNTFNLVLGILLLPGSLLLWFISFWIFRALFYIPLYWFGKMFWPRWDTASASWYIAVFCLPDDTETIRQATELFNQLHSERQWVARDSYLDQAKAVLLLEQMGLIWTSDKKGFDEIRIQPASDNSR